MDHFSSHQGYDDDQSSKDICPFCAMEFESELTHSYDKHVGYHLEDIRLLSLPPHFRDDSEGGEDFKDISDHESGSVYHGRGGLATIDEGAVPEAESTKFLNSLVISREIIYNRIAEWLSDDEAENFNDLDLV